MNAYVDSSVLLRIVLGQPNGLAEWREIRTGVSSAILEVECLRTLDRYRNRAAVPDGRFIQQRQAVFALIAELHVVQPTAAILSRAALPLPVPLGTLDAIHLATALLWRESRGLDLVMATHDAALAAAARSVGLQAIGA